MANSPTIAAECFILSLQRMFSENVEKNDHSLQFLILTYFCKWILKFYYSKVHLKLTKECDFVIYFALSSLIRQKPFPKEKLLRECAIKILVTNCKTSYLEYMH